MSKLIKPHVQAVEELDPTHILEMLYAMTHRDFGCPDDIADERYNPFDPAHVAWRAVDMLDACYNELEIDAIANGVIATSEDDDGEDLFTSDNLTTVH